MSTNIADFIGSKVKKKHFKPKHQKAKVFRASEPLLSVFMWGVNHTISGLTHVNVPIMLMPDDFKAFNKVKVDNHCFNKENMPSHFKVKEYCPLVFRNLRERFGINETDYNNSLTKSEPIPVESDKNKLYESYDKMFVIKSLQSEEVEFMHTLLKHYHPYIVEKHGKTLLPQYLGLYRVTVEGNETYLVVMRNIFSGTSKIHCKYDIKGTSVDREASAKEKTKELPTLKDGDFVQDGCKLHVGPEKKEKLLAMLSADTDFLASRVHLTDYSVCLGIHDCETDEDEDSKESENEEDEEGSEDSTTVVPTPPESPRFITFLEDSKEFRLPIEPYAISSCEDAPRKEVYCVGLVEILSHYGTRKRTATINNTQPEQYARRLVDFMAKSML